MRIRLPVQGTRVRAPAWGDRTCHGAARACAAEPAPQSPRAAAAEARVSEPVHHSREASTHHTWRKPVHNNEDPAQPEELK